MDNFVWSIPTEIYFGKGQIERLGEVAKKYGSRALIVYGGGSIKRNGIFDAATSSLKASGVEYFELSGVEPNPRVTSVNRGAELCREHNIDLLLPIGGGSSIDCAKAIAAAAFYDGDAWDLVKDRSLITKVLPIVTVLTLAATGSEMDPVGVISNMDTNEKRSIGHPAMCPRASIMDPSYTFTVNAWHTAAGTADIMSHAMENYFSPKKAYLQDRMTEAVLKTCVKYGIRAILDPNDYEARANLMWAGSWAINGTLSAGKGVPWSVHAIEHQLSAYYDITHGVGLAIVTPHWMDYVLSESTLERFVDFAVNVCEIEDCGDKWATARAGIAALRDYFKVLGIPMTLHEVGIDDKLIDTMAENLGSSLSRGYVPLTPDDVKKILRAAL